MVVINEKTVSEAINYRRSVRIYKKDPIDEQKVKEFVATATSRGKEFV